MTIRPCQNLRSLLLAFFVMLSILSFSCGYKLVREGEVALPSGLDSLSVPLAKNLTLEAGLEDIFTQELIKRLRADGRVEVNVPGKADAELKCTLNNLDAWPVSYTQEGKIGAEMIRLDSECKLLIPGSGSVVWNSGNISVAEEYPVGDNYLLNEDAKERALVEVAKDLSESIRSALLDAF